MTKILKTSLAAALCLSAAPALAGSNSVTIELNDYDLLTNAGYEAVVARIDDAARDLCRDTNMGSLISVYSQRRCRSDVRAAPVAELDAHVARLRVAASR